MEAGRVLEVSSFRVRYGSADFSLGLRRSLQGGKRGGSAGRDWAPRWLLRDGLSHS